MYVLHLWAAGLIFFHALTYRSIVQITRFEEHRVDDDPNCGLLELIKKKLKVQSDEFLQLVVLGDHTFDLQLPSLHQKLLGLQTIPYADIWLVARMGRPPQPGEFRCLELYPATSQCTVTLPSPWTGLLS